ncbi:MAG: hypothetical protein VW274_10245, partial [Thalassolituus sp.]
NSGSVYMVEALCSQFFGHGYSLTDDDLTKANGDILNLEREQQAEVVERYYSVKFQGNSEPSTGVSMALLEPLALQVFSAPVNITAGILRRLRSQPTATTAVRRVRATNRGLTPA